MSYNNSGRGTYNGGSNQRGSYRNSGSSYNGGQTQQGEQQEKTFGARFRIRGIACTNRDTGEGFTRINTRNGTAMCSVNVMVKKFRNTGERDSNGKTVWNEDTEYIRLVAFRKSAEDVMSIVKPKSIVDFSGEISIKKLDNGGYDTSYIIDKVELIREFSGSTSDGGQRNSSGYQRTNGQRGGFNYDERPNNYQRRATEPRPEREPAPQRPSVREDYAQATADNDDIPF